MEPLIQSALPERLTRLNDLAYDLWWTWNPLARDVFKRLDHSLWLQTAHNPVLMLSLMPPESLTRAAQDEAWLELFDRALAALDAARHDTGTFWATRMGAGATRPIAYFSAEFALHQSLPIYAGGLGVLAGDHCKEASDLGIPLLSIGFMYPQGYFRQRISSEGWQQEDYVRLDWTNAPVEPALTPAGHPCIVAVPLGNRSVLAQVWRIRMGRVTLLLLDTDLEENAPWDRELSARLYGGDRETRIQQEVILGIGGVRVIRAMGYDPAVWHLNEGHAAFVVLQRIREHMEAGLSFDDAREAVRRTTVFTTHTPVPAGHDAFPFQLVEQHLAGCWGDLGDHRDAFLALGLYDNGSGPLFNMTALALRSAGFTNAVSKLHRDVTAEMWAPIWPESTMETRPVAPITNGVHVPTWVSPQMAALFARYLGADWCERTNDAAFWDAVTSIPDEELWGARQALRNELFSFIRERARQRWAGEQASPQRVLAAGTLFDPNALTLGFARRFTAYKRPELIFHDAERLAAILNQSRRPVQIVFAGKAHPADDMGKHHLHHIFKRAIDPVFGGRVAFVDDYDLHVAHYLVAGVDVWLNNPRKPLEASGTSGMKAAINGVPHLSIGDGWWAEGYDGHNGWLIAGTPENDSPEAVDAADAQAMYALLENHVVPAFYQRDRHGIPNRWLDIVRQSIRTVTPQFSARRMLIDYVEKAYAPAYQVSTGKGGQGG
ncbi:MAG: alpha-glucan family phosphorylase [Acidobacteriota bacterium]|nr:alpha-glucan family phosphorylase [Acidobacteriota bacterium]